MANTATATGTDPDGDPVTSPPDTTTTPATRPAPALEVTKSAGTPVDVNGSGLTDAGDTIAFTFTVTNTGNVAVRDVAVVDEMLADAGVAVTCERRTLAPGETVTCAADAAYVVTAADEAAGAVANTATATGTDPDGDPVTSPPDTTTTSVTEPAPALRIAKSAGTPVDVNGSGLTDAGDTIAYTFTITNTGNVPVRGIGVDDPRLPGAAVCAPRNLAPGETATCTAAPYVVTAADERAGAVDNSATATGTDPDGDPVTSPPDTTSTPSTTPSPRSTWPSGSCGSRTSTARA